MEGLINVQKNLQYSINRAYSNFKKSPKERVTLEYIETRLESLEGYWSNFLKNHLNLCESFKPDDLKESLYETSNMYDDTEDTYTSYKSHMKRVLRELSLCTKIIAQPVDSDPCGTAGSFVKLPKISIPMFSGKYSEWTTFHNLFISLVHNNRSLDNVQRLHYLKSHLVGEAEQLIRHTPITEENYSHCWKLLEQRYNNKKYLSNCILKRLFGQRCINVESASALKELLDTTIECLSALKNLEIDVSTWDVIIIHVVTYKLDNETRKQWELSVSNNESNSLPTFEQFKVFLENRFRALECLDPKRVQHAVGSHTQRVLLATNTSKILCEYCSERHKLCFCKTFADLPYEIRREFVKKNNLCFNCLGGNHTVYNCKISTNCRLCNKRHHSLLHMSARQEYQDQNNGEKGSGEESDGAAIVSCFSTGRIRKSRQVLLATALINAKSKSGCMQPIRALLDQGSQACFITEAAVQLLRLKKTPIRGEISGLANNKSIITNNMVTLMIQSRFDSAFKMELKAYVLNHITSYIPQQKVEVVDWIEIKDLQLADPQFDIPSKIDILLGADIYSHILQEGMKKSPAGNLLAQSTALGWIISGVDSASSSNLKNDNNGTIRISAMYAQINENEILKRFWEIEEQTNSVQKVLTEEESKCEDLFKRTTKRTKEGQYVVTLPFRDEEPLCRNGDSRAIAVTKLKALERKLAKDQNLKERYTEVIHEYLRLGHMRPVGDRKNRDEGVYLPHHAVIREDKTTTKVRVVFDASSKNKNGVSLNDTLMVGPTLQPDLRHTVLRWRLHPIGIVADIVKMYRQVRIMDKDAMYQRIVWRDKAENEIHDYELMTVTFGTACAPYLAVRALNQTAIDEGVKYPLAKDKVLTSFYMDDLMTGCLSSEEGVELYKQMSALLGMGGFQLQKWSSNSDDLLKIINRHEKEKQNCINTEKYTQREEGKEKEIKLDTTTKVLGLTWDRAADNFIYSVNVPPIIRPITKRFVLSNIARLFDPLGWIAPSVIIAKIFIQKLWLLGTHWDEHLPSELEAEWISYSKDLAQLIKVQVPRWLGTNRDSDVQLHGFCDASKLAYAAVVYARVVDSFGNVRVAILRAKTRVAPIKQISIPRLELCGAVLLARLLQESAQLLDVSIDKVKAWTDSTVVLSWLNSHPSRWTTFVGNRVSEILTTMGPSQWFHISTKKNPADCASRGIPPSKLFENRLWFCGPEFLQDRNIVYNRPINLTVNIEESVKSFFSSISEDSLFTRFSSLKRLLRVIAFCRRFLKRSCNRTKYLHKREIDEALQTCTRKAQREGFTEEYRALCEDRCTVKRGSKLRSLCPYLDGLGIIRVSGRIQRSLLNESTKHPIVLPHTSHFTKLVIADAHEQTLHGGFQLMLNYLRSKYWIIGARSLIKQHVHKCVTCVKSRASVRTQLMGALPSVRCTPSRPFLHSGVDYAGPINIRTTKGRGQRSYKGYICLFVCMATRAIHLEAVSDMSSQAFLAAFRRFVSRRGHCAELWSDNGTTFVGAASELKNLQQFMAEHLEKNGTRWHFIPPHAPNFGGLWEAGVKSTKFHLKRVIGESTLTFEEMSTFLSQVEACLNSRPMTVINSDDPSEPLPLTPGHFLVGEPLVNIPDVNYENSNISSLTRWQLVQKMTQSFWKRWSQEYLTTLMNRYKWTSRLPEPNVGDVVLIRENDLPPSRWLLGRVVQKHPGPDNVSRVVTVRTKTSNLKRPTSKLCILPVTE